jgi:long-subunit fatty acid transport protein
MKKLFALLLLPSMFTTGFAAAESQVEEFLNQTKPNIFSYDYIESNFVAQNNMGVGFNLNGSYDIKPNFALIGGLQYTTKDDIDYTTISAGAAYHRQIAAQDIPGLDLVAHAELQQAFADTPSNDLSDFGIKLGAGIRYHVDSKLETFGDFSVTTTGNSAIIISGGARYTFAENLSAQAGYAFSDNNTLNIGIRYQFK